MKRNFTAALAALSVSVLLAACGGNDNGFVFEDEDPESSNLSGSLTIAGSSTAVFNGVYASNDVHLNQVEKVNPIGGDPELCRFRFDNIVQAGSGRVMNGDVRYQPGNPNVRVMFIALNGDPEYALDDAVGTVDRANDRIVFTAAPMTSGNGDTIELSGTLPMRDARPEGC